MNFDLHYILDLAISIFAVVGLFATLCIMLNHSFDQNKYAIGNIVVFRDEHHKKGYGIVIAINKITSNSYNSFETRYEYNILKDQMQIPYFCTYEEDEKLLVPERNILCMFKLKNAIDYCKESE